MIRLPHRYEFEKAVGPSPEVANLGDKTITKCAKLKSWVFGGVGSSEKAKAQPKRKTKPKPKSSRPAPFSIRLSIEERAVLEREAGGKPLGAHIRAKLLGEDQGSRKRSRRKAGPDAVALGRLLGMLGKSEQTACLFMLIAAAEAERIKMTNQERMALRAACADVREMRALLVQALGLKGESGGRS